MSPKTRRRYTEDFKQEGVWLVQESARPLAQVARDLWIPGNLLYRWRATTHSTHGLPVAMNTLNRQLTVEAPNRVWAGDITYVWTAEGWLYLAVHHSDRGSQYAATRNQHVLTTHGMVPMHEPQRERLGQRLCRKLLRDAQA